MNRNNQPFDPGWGDGPPMIRGQSRDWDSNQGPLRDPPSGWGSDQGLMRSDPIAPPPPAWGAINRQAANNWEDEPSRGGMLSQFSGRPSGFPPSSIKQGIDEMQKKMDRHRHSQMQLMDTGPRSGNGQMQSLLSMDPMGERARQMASMDMGERGRQMAAMDMNPMNQMHSMDMGGRGGQMQSMDMGGRPGDTYMRQQRRTPSPPMNNLWNENDQNARQERESLRSHPRNMMEPEQFRNRQFEQEHQSHSIMDEVDVIWESAKNRRQDRRSERPRTPSPPRQRRQSPPRRPVSPPPPRFSRRSRSPSPPPIPQFPEKVYSCICRIVLFEDSCQAGVVELAGSGGHKAYCFFLAKHVVSRSISKLSSQLRTGNLMKVNARLVSAKERLPYLASTLWSDKGEGGPPSVPFFDPDQEDQIKYQQLAGHLARQLDTQLSSGQVPQMVERSSRDSRERSRDGRSGPGSIPFSNPPPPVSDYPNPHSLPPPVSIGRAPVLPKPTPAVPRRDEERRQRDGRDGYQHGDVWKAIKQGSQRNPPKSRLAEEFFTESQNSTDLSQPPPLSRAQMEDQRRLAEEFKRQEERERERVRKIREETRKKRLGDERDKQTLLKKKQRELEKNKPRKFVEHLDDNGVKKGINQIQKKIQDLESRIIPAADKLGISAKEVDKFGYAVRSGVSQSKRSSPEVIEIVEGTKSASEVYQSMFNSDQQEKSSERSRQREKSSDHRRERSPQREKRSRNRSRSKSPAHKRRTTSPPRKSTGRDGVSQRIRERQPRSSRSPTHRHDKRRSKSRSPRRSQHRSSKSKEPQRHSYKSMSKSPLRFGQSKSKSPRARRNSGRRSSRSRSRNRGDDKMSVPSFLRREDMSRAMKDSIEKIKSMSDTEKDDVERVYVMIEAEMLFDGEFRQLTHIGASASASRRQLSFFRSIIPNYIAEYTKNLVTKSESNLLAALAFKFDEGLKSYKFSHLKKGDIIPHKESEALEELMSFLRSVSENKKEIILFTHSSEMLLPVLLAKLDFYGLSKEFNELVNGFCDLTSCLKNLKLGEIWKNTKFTDLSDIYKHVMGRSWPRENRHCDGVSVLCGSIVKRMVKDYEDFLSAQNLQFSHAKFLDMCGRQTLEKFKTSNKDDLSKVVCTPDLKREDISFVEFYPSDRPNEVVVVPLKRCDIIEVVDVDDVEEEGIDDEVYFELEALEASVVNETFIKPGHFATVSLLILTKKRSSSSSIFEDHLDGQYVLVAKNNYFKKEPKRWMADTEVSKTPTEKCQISRQIVKVLRTLRPCSDSEDMCEAVYVVQIKVLNPSDWMMCLEHGDNIAVYRKEKLLGKEEQMKRSYAKDDELPCPRTPPAPVKEKKKKKKAKQVQPVDYDSLDFDALDFEPTDSEDETTDDEDNSKVDSTEGLKESLDVDENQEAAPSYPSEAELFVKMNVKQLKEELSKAGLNIYGLKKDLVKRMFEYKKKMALNPLKANLKKNTAEKIEAVRREEEAPGLRIEALEVVNQIIEDVFKRSTRHPVEELLDDIIDQATIQTYGPHLNRSRDELNTSCTQIDSDEDIIEDSSNSNIKFHEKLYRPFLTETLNIMPKKKAKVRITLLNPKLDIFVPELEGRKVLVKQNMEESETCQVDEQICMVNIVRDSIYDYDKATIDVIVTNPYSDEIYVDGSEERRIVLVQLEKLEKEELNDFEIPEDENIGNRKVDEVFDETVYMATTTSDIEMAPRSYHLEKCSITMKGKDMDFMNLKSDKLILIKRARKGALQIGTRKLILVPQQLKVLEYHPTASKVYFVEIKLFNASKQGLRISKRTLIGDVRIEKENFFSESKKIARAFELPLSLKPFTSKIIMCQLVEGRKCQEGQLAVVSNNKHKANNMLIKEGLAAVEIKNGISCVPLIISNRGDTEINIRDEYDCYTKVRLEKMQEEDTEDGMGGPRGFVDLPYGACHLSDGVEPEPPGEEKNENEGSEEIEEITLD